MRPTSTSRSQRPIAFIAYANHVRNTVGVNWLGALGAIVALSLVIATVVISNRR